MLNAFCIPNHSSHDLTRIPVPELANVPTHPPFSDKKQFVAWCHAPSTKHCFYSLAEPRDPSRRANKKDNPIVALHGLVADYEGLMSDQLLAEAIVKSGREYPINYRTKTFSGGARLIWLFEKPLSIINHDLAVEVLGKAMKEMKLVRLLPGLDEPAFLVPSQPYELGTNFTVVNGDARITTKQANKWLFDCAKKLDWKVADSPAIAIEDIAAEVERKFPNRWQGPFAVGSLGVRFWESGADNPTGAWIREHGVVAFSGENRFIPWEEILGKEFVKRYETDRIGGAITDCFFDGKAYWHKDGLGRWHDSQTEVLRRRLRNRGLQAEGRKGQMSELDKALAHIEDNCRVDGAFPFLFNDREVVEEGARRYLNVSRIRAMAPADGTHAWGENFPWLADHLSHMFPGDQLDAFRCWHRHFWFNAWQNRRTKGHALFIAGDANAGKTLLAWRVIGASVGGFQEATSYILGKTEFNAPLFESPLGTVDDAIATADRNSHDVYSQIVKKLVANPSLTYRRMYANPITMPYYGRILVTLNNDPVSIGMLPSTDGSILDKIIFLLASSPKTKIPSDVESIIARELPFYLAFLRDYKAPESLTGDARFGMVAYKNEEMLASARAGSSSSEFAELLDMWKEQYFRANGDDKTWEGSSSDLMMEFQQTDGLKELVRSTVRSTTYLGRLMSQLSTIPGTGVLVISGRTSRGRIFKVTRNA